MSSTKMLSADEILDAKDTVIEPVDVPEWGGRVFVRSVASSVIDAFEAANAAEGEDGKQALAHYRARLATLTVCDESGNFLFTEKHAPALARKSAAALRRVARVSLRLNGMTQERVEDAKKNSESDPSDASPTASP